MGYKLWAKGKEKKHLFRSERADRRSACPLCSGGAVDNRVAKAEDSAAEEIRGPLGREDHLRIVSVPSAVLWFPISQGSLVSRETALSADPL
jgi:hypothetical protein